MSVSFHHRASKYLQAAAWTLLRILRSDWFPAVPPRVPSQIQCPLLPLSGLNTWLCTHHCVAWPNCSFALPRGGHFPGVLAGGACWFFVLSRGWGEEACASHSLCCSQTVPPVLALSWPLLPVPLPTHPHVGSGSGPWFTFSGPSGSFHFCECRFWFVLFFLVSSDPETATGTKEVLNIY